MSADRIGTTYETATVLGCTNMPMNVWGKTTLLLSLLYREGHLPDCHIYALTQDDADREGTYFINGEPVGKTEAEVTTSVWRMVERYKAHGHLFA